MGPVNDGGWGKRRDRLLGDAAGDGVLAAMKGDGCDRRYTKRGEGRAPLFCRMSRPELSGWGSRDGEAWWWMGGDTGWGSADKAGGYTIRGYGDLRPAEERRGRCGVGDRYIKGNIHLRR